MTTYLRGEITRWVSDDFPGFVECQFVDRFGVEWIVVDKAPVLMGAGARSDSQLPQPVFIEGEIITLDKDDTGREIAEITTTRPSGIESIDGTSRFQLYADQLRAAPTDNAP